METTGEFGVIRREAQEFVGSVKVAIASENDYLTATDILKEIKRRMKAIDDRLEPEKAKAYKAYQAWGELIRELKGPYLEKEKEIKAAVKAWLDEQEALRREEEKRLRELAMKQAEKEKERLIRKLEKAGHIEQAEAVRQEEIRVPPVAVVPKAAVEGISQRSNWKFKIVDESLIPRSFLRPDEVKLGQYARAMKGDANVPGVEFYEEKIVAVKT
ncbi:MAG TPA: hypothetical protein PK684_08975 [Bacillota bacterium]|nr:hypothetical protein [Bacillota bacterium]